MNWGECKLAALQTMFANEGAAINIDDSNQDYVHAMPAKANEAMHQLATIGRPILKKFFIEIRSGAAEGATAEKLTLPSVDGSNYKITMTAYCPRFRALERNQLMLETDDGYGRAQDWDIEGDDVLILPGELEGTYTVWYDAYPVKITAGTADDTELELAEEAAVLVPLYIAAELYKEDELAMATMFRNEFEDGLLKLQISYQSSPKGGTVSKVRNTTGWW